MVPAPSPQAYTARHLTEQILASPTALEGERKQVTVLFADVVGSTKRVGDLDPEDGKRLLDGATRVAMEMPGAGALHNLIAALVYELLRDFVRARDLGLVFTDGVACIVGRRPDRVRIPDASFVSWERVPEGGVPEGFWPLAPDLAVEVVSPNDRADDVHGKVREYLDAGARLMWVLWPRRRSVSAHTPDGMTRELGPDEALDGGDLLPGFRAGVAELFDVRTNR